MEKEKKSVEKETLMSSVRLRARQEIDCEDTVTKCYFDPEDQQYKLESTETWW